MQSKKKTRRQANAAARASFIQHAPPGEVARLFAAERAKRAKHNYEVIVGNVGSVYRGGSKKKALKESRDYVRISMGYGPTASRADGESVVLMCDDNICKEYIGSSHRDED